jgi:hypothetical protein
MTEGIGMKTAIKGSAVVLMIAAITAVVLLAGGGP